MAHTLFFLFRRGLPIRLQTPGSKKSFCLSLLGSHYTQSTRALEASQLLERCEHATMSSIFKLLLLYCLYVLLYYSPKPFRVIDPECKQYVSWGQQGGSNETLGVLTWGPNWPSQNPLSHLRYSQSALFFPLRPFWKCVCERDSQLSIWPLYTVT